MEAGSPVFRFSHLSILALALLLGCTLPEPPTTSLPAATSQPSQAVETQWLTLEARPLATPSFESQRPSPAPLRAAAPSASHLQKGSKVYFPHIERAREPTPTPTRAIPEGANILILMSDDQRYDSIAFMPRTQRLIFDQGVTFTRAYVPTSSCCPSRASLLTGLYARNHGVKLNQDPLLHATIVHDLQAAGYFTGLVGKYLNSWDGSRREEFDFWVSFAGGEAAYYDPILNVQGEWREQQGYITHLFEQYALDFLDRALAQEAPFFLLFTPNAPHEPALPAPGDEDLYPNLEAYRPPSFNEEDIEDKPDWLQGYESLTSEQILAIDELRRSQLQSLNALDLAVESLLHRLERAGELNNTFIVYLSDNGFYWGEHRRRSGKGYAWEESIHVPMAIRYPPLASQSRSDDHLVSNLDLAPSIYQLAGLPEPPGLDGKSLLPLVAGEEPPWRDRLVIENWIRFGPYLGVRTDGYLYIEWEYDKTELYDMEVDPYQLVNQAENPAYAEIVAAFHRYVELVRAGED